MGSRAKPWVKTSLAPAPGRRRVSRNISACSSTSNMVGFNLVGFGCTTCIGNSGPLPEEISSRSTTTASSPRRALG
jgi:aconitate hydratase